MSCVLALCSGITSSRADTVGTSQVSVRGGRDICFPSVIKDGSTWDMWSEGGSLSVELSDDDARRVVIMQVIDEHGCPRCGVVVDGKPYDVRESRVKDLPFGERTDPGTATQYWYRFQLKRRSRRQRRARQCKRATVRR